MMMMMEPSIKSSSLHQSDAAPAPTDATALTCGALPPTAAGRELQSSITICGGIKQNEALICSRAESLLSGVMLSLCDYETKSRED